MKLRRFDSDILKNNLGITIGSFDGVHKGHQFLLKNFYEKCREKSLLPVVISFSPHPAVFIGKKVNYLLDSSHKKRELLKKFFSIEFIEIEFNESIMLLSGEKFFDELFRLLPKIKLLYTGHDFSLGQGKKFGFIAAKSYLKNIEVIQADEYKEQSRRISSTEIRESIKSGDLKKANQLLGHIFKLTATVVHGNKIGRTLGFPTANLYFDTSQILPENGVYQTRCTVNGVSYKSIVNIGTRPTVTDDKTRVVEVNIFDFNRDIYQEIIDIEFFSKIREEKKFKTKDDLIEQIRLDKIVCAQSAFYGPMALIGSNIKHSKSASIYKSLLSNNYIDYTLVDICSLKDIALRELLTRYPYVSVTAPFKTDAYKACDIVENNQYGFDSINSLKLVDNKIIGTNTDSLAITEILSKIELKNKEIYILGDGAMSSIVEKILITKKINFIILSRRNNNLNTLSELKMKNIFIINTTAREYTPTINSHCEGHFWDFNYNQSYNETIKKNKNLKYSDGLDLLTRQAKFALSFWNLKSL